MNSNINQPGEERGQAFLENLGRGKTIYEIEAEEENLLLDAIEDYKTEYSVKTVKTNSKKFKQFFKRWKRSE